MIYKKDDYDYVGWVPCVNGHLDFGLMKVGIKGGFTNSDFKDANVVEHNLSANQKADSHHRKIVLQSKVDWRDSEDENKNIGIFRLFTCAEVNESDDINKRYLTATVLIYPLITEPESLEDKRNLRLHQLSHELSGENVYTHFSELEELVSQGEKIPGLKPDCFKASLSIFVEPDGIIYLKFLPNSSDLDPESKFIIARQIYYYIKYALHSHRHHIDEQDSLTTITSNSEGSGLRLLCQLKRELTTLSRVAKFDNSTHSTNDSFGIIAYSKSLIAACKKNKLIKKGIALIELDRLDNVKNSFSALNSSINRNESITELVKSKAKVWLGFSLIFLWGVSNFLLNASSTNKITIEEPHFIPFAILIVVALVYLAFIRYYRIKHDSHKVIGVYYLSTTKTIVQICAAAVGVLILWFLYLSFRT